MAKRSVVVLSGETASGFVKISYEREILNAEISIKAKDITGGGYYLAIMDNDITIVDFNLGKSGRIQKTIQKKCRMKIEQGVVCAFAEVDFGKIILHAKGGTQGRHKYDFVFNDFFSKKEYFAPKSDVLAAAPINVYESADAYEREDTTASDFLSDEKIATVNYYLDEAMKHLDDKVAGGSEETAATAITPAAKAENTIIVKNVEPEKPEVKPIVSVSPSATVPQILDLNIAKPEEAAKSGGVNFFDSIASDIKQLFERHESERGLERLIDDSKWVKVKYDRSENYYTVGVIYDDDKPTYICYGVPSKYSKNPPKELLGFCEWIPGDVNVRDYGYWMMYQDANSGETLGIN